MTAPRGMLVVLVAHLVRGVPRPDLDTALVEYPAAGLFEAVRPLGGDWPTRAWEPGQMATDTRLAALPPNLHAGRYDVRLGFYDPSTGARLTAWKPDGSPWPEDAVVLEGVVVK